MRPYLTENEVSLGERQKAKLLAVVEHLEQNEEYRTRACLKNHSGHLYAPLCAIFVPNSGYIARYAPFIWRKSPTNCDAYLAESIFQTRPRRRFLNLFFTKVPCEENGYRAFDYDKFCAMVLFFAHKSTELLKTKLMKLLNYSDMIFYKENGISISGVRYAHLPYGPVPENFDILLGTMAADHIAHIEVFYDSGYEKHQVIPEEEMPDGILSDDELEVLERIYNKFANFGSVDISNYSHREKGYTETKKGEIISYSYAKDIELD